MITICQINLNCLITENTKYKLNISRKYIQLSPSITVLCENLTYNVTRPCTRGDLCLNF